MRTLCEHRIFMCFCIKSSIGTQGGYFVLVFFSPFNIVITSLGEE